MLWVKTLHILTVISWLAGIFYLPRIFVHYAEGKLNGEDVTRLIIMAVNLFRFMSLMALLALGFGLLLWLWFSITGHWLYIKLVFVMFLMGYHLVCWNYLKQICNEKTHKSGKFYRRFNEFSLLFILPILVLVVVKPV